MAPRPDTFRPVDAYGTVRIDAPGGRAFDLVADGENLRLTLPDIQSAGDISPPSFRARRRTLRSLASALATHGLTLRLEADGKPLLWLGLNASPSWLARLFRLGPVYVPFSTIRAILSSPFIRQSSA
jgi:hypothetical protein